MSKAYELAKGYYPTYWGIEQIMALTKAGKLTPEEYLDITGQEYVEDQGE